MASQCGNPHNSLAAGEILPPFFVSGAAVARVGLVNNDCLDDYPPCVHLDDNRNGFCYSFHGHR